MHNIKINEQTDDAILNLVLNTLEKKKQALVFVNTKRSAESEAEKIASQTRTKDSRGDRLSLKVLHALPSPTRQCKRLAGCIKKGIAFHHSGLASKQRSLIEGGFREGTIRIIVATPTLALGVDLPAFRTIIRDLKRYGGSWGMSWIPVLEYHQQAGRAGRPKFDSHGEAICIARSEPDKEDIVEKYILGEPEPIYSKLAVEPVLRTHILSLVASNFINTKEEMLSFFEKTFYGHQYRDIKELDKIISRILHVLSEWGFIEVFDINNDFVSASEITKTKLTATKLGERVSQLYLDPYTASNIISCLMRAKNVQLVEFSFLTMITNTLELRPLFRARIKEIQHIQDKLSFYSPNMIVAEPSIYEPEYDNFINSIKTAAVFEEWMNEKGEDFILETYGVTPGEFRAKLDIAKWLLFSAEELSRLLDLGLISPIRKTRLMLVNGVKEELLPLVKLRGIGRIRARKLYRNNIQNLGDIKKENIIKLSQLIGKETAIKVKEQVGIKFVKVPKGKRKGQKSVEDY